MVLLPSKFYGKMGVNIHHLKVILSTKLMMDDRRPVGLQQLKKTNTPPKGFTIKTIGVSALMGVTFLMGFYLGNDEVLQLTIYFSMYIFLLSASLISDFTSVLIDVRDNYIILPKPVNDRTIVVGRLLHIIIHVSKIIIPMTLPGLVYMCIASTIPGILVFVLMVFFSTLFTIFIINAAYLLILKVTTPSKFQRIISYFQVVFAIFIYASYQLVPRLMGKMQLEDYVIPNKTWAWLAPSFWFAKSWKAITYFKTDVYSLSAVFATIVFPIASIYIVVKYLAPSFNQKLSLINSGNAEQSTASFTRVKKHGTTAFHVRLLAKLLSKKGSEHMAFLFTWKMTGRSKDFMMKVYPVIGYLVVLAIMPFVQSKSLNMNAIKDPSGIGPFALLGILYFSTFIVGTAMIQVAFNEKYKASWIYYTTPIASPGFLLTGSIKAIMAKFILPMALIIGTACFTLFGIPIIPNFMLALVNTVLSSFLIAYLTNQQLPFAAEQNNNMRSGSFIRGLFMMLIPGVFAVFHYFIYSITPVVIILTILSAIAVWLVDGSFRNFSWAKIKSGYE